MIVHSYKYMSPAELESFSALVTTRFGDNPIFATIKEAALLGLLPAHKAFTAAKQDYDKFKGKDRSDLRETRRLTLVEQLFLTSLILVGFAKTDMSIIEASGYAMRKTSRDMNKKPVPPVTVPLNFLATNILSKSGAALLTWTEVKNALNYGIEFRIKGEALWQNGQYTSNNRIELTGFLPNSIVEFRIRTLGEGEDKSEFTAPFPILVS